MVAYVVETLVTLAGVVALAIALLHFAGGRRFGASRPSGPLDLIGRLPLDLQGRRTIYLVRVGAKLYIVGASDAGLAKLGELDASEIPGGPKEHAG
jgi:flagellar biogenesis protein FliO